jgi:hypothetical protein
MTGVDIAVTRGGPLPAGHTARPAAEDDTQVLVVDVWRLAQAV